MSKRFRNISRILAITAIVLAAITCILDKSLPYRIGQNYYLLFLWVERLTIVSILFVIAALLTSVATRQWLFVAFLIVGIFLLLSIGGPHSGPNPEAWCYNNLRKIDAAKDALAEKNHLTNGTVVTSEQLSHFIEGGYDSLHCAEKGAYVVNSVGIESRCTFHGSISEMETNWNRLRPQKRPEVRAP
jgi:hypothetical protein